MVGGGGHVWIALSFKHVGNRVFWIVHDIPRDRSNVEYFLVNYAIIFST